MVQKVVGIEWLATRRFEERVAQPPCTRPPAQPRPLQISRHTVRIPVKVRGTCGEHHACAYQLHRTLQWWRASSWNSWSLMLWQNWSLRD